MTFAAPLSPLPEPMGRAARKSDTYQLKVTHRAESLNCRWAQLKHSIKPIVSAQQSPALRKGVAVALYKTQL